MGKFRIPAEEDFNPRSPWGERPLSGAISARTSRFQSTLPVGGATYDMIYNEFFRDEFQSTLPVGGATIPIVCPCFLIAISIHAPRGGSDVVHSDGVGQHPDFNPRSLWGERLVVHPPCRPVSLISIHAPRGGSDVGFGALLPDTAISIHAPRGGSDPSQRRAARQSLYFNPRSPWGERPPIALKTGL